MLSICESAKIDHRNGVDPAFRDVPPDATRKTEGCISIDLNYSPSVHTAHVQYVGQST